MRSSHRAMFWWFRNGWAQEICWISSLTRCVTFWSRFKRRGSRRRMGWGQLVFEFNKITGSAAAKPSSMPIFTSYPLSEEKRLELPRQGESCRRRNITRQRRSCVRPGRRKQSKKNGVRGTCDIEGKATRVGASEPGGERVSKKEDLRTYRK